jgi:hypothetical protein
MMVLASLMQWLGQKVLPAGVQLQWQLKLCQFYPAAQTAAACV